MRDGAKIRQSRRLAKVGAPGDPSFPDQRETRMSLIASIDTRLFHIPLVEVLVDAKHGDHTHFELVTTTITLKDGSQGTGYTYTGGKGGFAIAAMIERDLAPFLIGRDSTVVESLYEGMQWHVHYCQL